ncbi:MAG: hypothetical protein WCE54_08280 [Ignavibacteriaceae bacterium]
MNFSKILKLFLQNKIAAILFLGFFIRLAATFSFVDLKKDYYWEYGEISKNIIHGNGYSLFYFNGN